MHQINCPEDVYNQRRGRIKVNFERICLLCTANNVDGFPCDKRAVNRSLYCTVHGGALHPLDKKMTPQTYSVSQNDSIQDRIEKLDRVQRFMQGFLTVEELDDDEIVGGYVRDSNGNPIANQRIGVRFQQDMVKELARRMNKFLQMKLPNMLKVVTDIAESDIVEPQDRLKAAVWAAERVIGKTPEVIVHGRTDKPYESIFENIESGSREAYRVNSQRAIEVGEDETILDAEIESEDESEDESVENSLVKPVLSTESEKTYDVKPADKVEKYISLEQHRADVKAKKDRIKKAKSRRYAARAAGAPTVADTPWLIDWRRRQGGVWCAKIVLPEAQTPAQMAIL